MAQLLHADVARRGHGLVLRRGPGQLGVDAQHRVRRLRALVQAAQRVVGQRADAPGAVLRAAHQLLGLADAHDEEEPVLRAGRTRDLVVEDRFVHLELVIVGLQLPDADCLDEAVNLDLRVLLEGLTEHEEVAARQAEHLGLLADLRIVQKLAADFVGSHEAIALEERPLPARPQQARKGAQRFLLLQQQLHARPSLLFLVDLERDVAEHPHDHVQDAQTHKRDAGEH
mmetsp:Transcript_102959/g.266201  ORF Transcript_102959/g.266201 Transcript_102959/m.266201 type:complete len:228 (+) Transcript_102959:2537-3220(+)